MQIACSKPGYKEQHSEAAYRATLHHLQLRADPLRIKPPFRSRHLQPVSLRRERRSFPPLCTNGKETPTHPSRDGATVLDEGGFYQGTSGLNANISQIPIPSEVAVLLMNAIQVHELQSSFGTFKTLHKCLNT